MLCYPILSRGHESNRAIIIYIISLSNSLIFRSFLVVSLIIFLGLPLPLTISLPCFWSILLATKSTCLVYTWQNHPSRVSTIFSTIGATPKSLSIVRIKSNKKSRRLWTYQYHAHEHRCRSNHKSSITPFHPCPNTRASSSYQPT